MNRNAQLWVNALESGSYRQAKGRLRKGNSYCCLGIACEEFRLATKKGKWIHLRDGLYAFRVDGQLYSYALPRLVVDWLRLNSEAGYLGPVTDDKDLVCLNDKDRLSLPEIAATIRAYEKVLFRLR